MTFTKFSATCGLTIVAHGSMKIYSGDHIKQCLDAVCTSRDTLNVFADGITNDPTLFTNARTNYLNIPKVRTVIEKIPARMLQNRGRSSNRSRSRSRGQNVLIPFGVLRASDPFFTLGDDSVYPCALLESWLIRHPTTTGVVFTVVELYNIKATSEQFTFSMCILDAAADAKDPFVTKASGESVATDKPGELTFNVGRQSELTMYCVHCHANVHTKTCSCNNRRFCSSECQKADWHEGGHKYDHLRITIH
jgi:hypothetical protein